METLLELFFGTFADQSLGNNSSRRSYQIFVKQADMLYKNLKDINNNKVKLIKDGTGPSIKKPVFSTNGRVNIFKNHKG